jgi:hemolysin-activating ACP:hemolysin acyltransferase
MSNVHALSDIPTPRAVAGVDALRFGRERDPRVGFAESIAHLMTKPAFARAPFGHIARVLAGQVRRGHYALVKRGPRIVGFVGWARADEAHAEAWLAGTGGLSDAEARAGDCALVNCWQADDPAVSRFIMARLAPALAGCRAVYAKRHYPDGRVRPVRLPVSRRTGAAPTRQSTSGEAPTQ